ncbi:lipopolysaccharide biosynthesis protein [Carboxylicivirga sp. RSCT41]|uniref:lipopolysaccharide biosynthesis protein n=1 Tax=Carboxylicivirga agarovorans TaxID=3417570 RepID=UPI003D34B561
MLGKLRELFKESFFYGIGNFLTKASGLYLLPLYSTYLTKEEIGLMGLYETAFFFLMAIAAWGTKSGFTRWYNDMPTQNDRKSLFFTTYAFNVISNTIGVVLTAIILFNLNVFDTEGSERIIPYFCLSGLFRLLYDVPFIMLRVQQKAFKQTTYQTLNIGFTILFTFYQLEIKNNGFEGIYIGQLMANGLTFLITTPLIIKSCHFRFKGTLLKEMIRYGYPLAVSNVLLHVLAISDRYILEAYYSLADVGSYSVATKVTNLLQFLVMGTFITSYTFQYYKSLNEEDNSRYHIKIFSYFMLFMVLTGIAITYFSKEIIFIIMAGKVEYFDAVPVIPFLMTGLIFSGMQQVFKLPLTKAKLTRLISIVTIGAGTLNVGLNFLVIPQFGKEGAAVTTAVTQLTAALCFLYQSRKIEGTQYEWRKIALLLILGIVFCGGFFLIPSINIVLDIVVKLCLLTLFILCLFIFNFFEPIEKQRITEAWTKWNKPRDIIDNIKSLNKK